LNVGAGELGERSQLAAAAAHHEIARAGFHHADDGIWRNVGRREDGEQRSLRFCERPSLGDPARGQMQAIQ
jgi:hypothetical protein